MIPIKNTKFEFMSYIKHFLPIIAVSLILVSCKSKKEDESIVPAQELYDAGLHYLDKKEYKKASSEFEKVFYQHPGNQITPRAELMNAYTLYLMGEYDDAVDILDVFIGLHPRHEDIAYAYYLKALSSYTQISSVKLDQSRTKQARDGLEEVINRFPGSKYAIDAALKLDLANDHLAGKEMMVGRYYLKKKNPIAAIRRFQIVVEEYDTTSHIQEALYRLVESNMMMGLTDEAQKYAEVLKYNYPDSSWYKHTSHLLK
jgi:outer membrane protein assembly factor BamD